MCGILGTVNRPFTDNVLDLLYHRGPDDSGISQASVGRHILTLGFRRLAILDLSPAGRQPMWSSCQKHAIVFNGEIYNHQELRARIPPMQYRGHSDTETILNFLAHHGIESVDSFNGIFAFGFVDLENQKLFLARDPFGTKPLYYCSRNGFFVFSSELRAIRQFVDEEIETRNLAELLRLRYLPAPDTLFKNIHRVRPGHIVEVDLRTAHLTIREYPFIRPRNFETALQSRTDAVEHYGYLLDQAVRRQLLSDVKVGVLLSGGIDSALVASIAQRHAGYPMQAFTVGFSSSDAADEVQEAAETAKIVGLEHHDVRIGFREFLDLLPRIAAIVEEPLATTSMVPMFYLSSLASRHVKVVLSGQGADEALGGYRRYQAELLRSWVPALAIPTLKRGAQFMRVRSDAILRGLESLEEADDVRRFEEIYSVFSREQIRNLIGDDANPASERIRYFFDLLECSKQPHSVERMMSLDLRMNLSDDLLLYTDKVTMHHSLECRVPLLDLDLVRFVESLPCRYRVGIFRGKVLHKRFAKCVLPSSIIGRKKKGFLSPTASWFKTTNVIREILLDPGSRFSSYFDLHEVEKILQEHAEGRNRERHIFLLLNVYYWMAAGSRFDTTATGDRMAVHA